MLRRIFVGAAAASLVAGPGRSQTATQGGDASGTAQLIIAALAALDRHGQIDASMVIDYLGYLRESGIESILVNGSTGEFASFTTLERKFALQTYLRHKGNMRALCHVGASSLPDTLDLMRHAQGAGAEVALVLPPYYYKNPSIDGLIRFFEPVLETSRIPVLLYNIPQVSAVSIPIELVRRLSGHPNLLGIKDSWGKAEWTAAYIREFPDLSIYTGASALIEGVLKQGGAGALTGNGNLFPVETLAIFDAHRSGADTSVPQQKLNQLVSMLKDLPVIPAMKYVLSRMDVAKMHLRAPLTELTKAQKLSLSHKFRGAGLID